MTDKDPSDRKDLTASFEMVTKIGAAFLGLAYVSGYLIVNTYLASFGINGDAIQVFKSKYAYVGFLYVLLLSSIVLIFTVVKKAWDLTYVYAQRKQLFEEKLSGERPRVSPRGPAAAGILKLKEWSFMLWVLLVAALVIPISLELILLNSNSYKDHMVAQFGLLCSVILYQLTYYRVYRDSEWDRDSQKVFWRRACCVVLAGVFIILLRFPALLHWMAHWFRQHPICGVALVVTGILAALWFFRILFLTSDERKLWENEGGSSWKWESWRRLWFWVLVFPAVGLIWIPTSRYSLRWWLIQNVGLLMAISVLAGVIVFSIQANEQRNKEGLPHETTTTARVVRWVLRATVGVTLYVVSTLGYAYAVYNHIPVQKEGGDYTTSSIVSIVTDHPDLVGSLCDKVSGQDRPEKPSTDYIVILSQDSTYLYAACLDDWNPRATGPAVAPGLQECAKEYQCGPKHWRDGLLEKCGPFRPRVFAINQKSIVLIRELGKVSDHADCSDVLAR